MDHKIIQIDGDLSIALYPTDRSRIKGPWHLNDTEKNAEFISVERTHAALVLEIHLINKYRTNSPKGLDACITLSQEQLETRYTELYPETIRDNVNKIIKAMTAQINPYDTLGMSSKLIIKDTRSALMSALGHKNCQIRTLMVHGPI